MFTDARSKKVVLLAHCILNQNSISDGTADFPSQVKKVVQFFLKNKIGIIQMPCPELMCLGLDRGDVHGAERPVVVENTRIRTSLNKPNSKKKLQPLVKQTIHQIKEYKKNGFSILGVVGINRSPSCGINTTSMNDKEVSGQGVFMKALQEELKKEKINLKFVGIKTSKMKETMNSIKEMIE